jgi:uncharacterized protein
MTVQTSYPGIYIQELPSLVHAIMPAPTSITVFVGYTNPFYASTNYGTALRLNSFADYQANFGGFFSCPWQPDYLGQAVYQFFQNGGPTCYVVALQAQNYYDSTGSRGQIAAANVPITVTGGTITFTARQPVGVPAAAPATGTVGIPLTVAFSNPSSTNDTADIVVSYGTTAETYRQVQITNLVTRLQPSNLVTVTLTDTPTAYPAAGRYPLDYSHLSAGQIAPNPSYTVINPPDFGPVFEDYASLDKVPIFNLLATPGVSSSLVTSAAVAYCERKRAFYIMDTPSSSQPPSPASASQPASPGWDVNSVIGVFDQSGELNPPPPVSINAAVYYPWLQTPDPVTGQTILMPPSGFVAGIYGQNDNSQGVWQSPAGLQTSLTGTTGVDPNGVMTDPQQGILNINAINCLRQFPGSGTVVFGARTTAAADIAFQQWKYVAVRRMALFIEQSLYGSLGWAVFQGNAQPLWDALTQEVNAFMAGLYRQGAFAGPTPKDSFLVRCDETTTTPQDVLNGVVNVLVGFAPLVPAEFVVIQIAQLAGQTQS